MDRRWHRLHFEAVPGLGYAALPARRAVPHLLTGAVIGSITVPVLVTLVMTPAACWSPSSGR